MIHLLAEAANEVRQNPEVELEIDRPLGVAEVSVQALVDEVHEELK